MKNLTLFLIFALLLFPAAVFAFTVSDITNHGAPEARFYPQQFDQLVLDITIPSGKEGEADKLLAMTVKNEWTAQDIYDIRELILWKDSGKQGFQGLGIDQEIGQFVFYSNETGWYLSDLNVDIPEQGQRFFVAVEIAEAATNERVLQMKVPMLQDQNQNGQFEPGDSGIFLQSKNNGPKDSAILNPYEQTIRTPAWEEMPPKVVITDPQDGATITTSTYKILGLAKDQGGSTPQWVKLAINNIWYDVVPTSGNYATWEYVWQNIEEGTYVLKTLSRDWLENSGMSDEITITVAFPVPVSAEDMAGEEEEAVEEAEPEPEPEAEEEEEAEETTIEQLQAKIAELKEKIKQLLIQLIQLLQAKIEGLRQKLSTG